MMPRLAIALCLTCHIASGEPTAADVADAPLPDQASGRVDPIDDGDTTGREIGRAALFIPRWTLDAALTPVRELILVHNRYDLGHADGGAVASRRSLSIEPTVGFASGFGLTGGTAGALATIHDVAGDHEHVSLLAVAGAGSYVRQLYAARADTGHRLGDRFVLAFDGGYEDRPRDQFYGIGNTLGPMMRFSQDRARAELAGDLWLWSDLHVRPAAATAWSSVGSEVASGELAVRWDNRTSAGEWDPVHEPTSGTFAELSAARDLSAGADYWHYAADAQQLVRLTVGPRVLALRLHGEGITADRTDVPFVELPALGGPLYLRGYALDALRDRIAAFGSLEYRWDLARWIEAHAYIDAGRVYESMDALTLHDLRVGYGITLDFGHGAALVDLASSIDGGAFVSVALHPIADLEQRARPQ